MLEGKHHLTNSKKILNPCHNNRLPTASYPQHQPTEAGLALLQWQSDFYLGRNE